MSALAEDPCLGERPEEVVLERDAELGAAAADGADFGTAMRFPQPGRYLVRDLGAGRFPCAKSRVAFRMSAVRSGGSVIRSSIEPLSADQEHRHPAQVLLERR